jgi:hypothetical protein
LPVEFSQGVAWQRPPPQVREVQEDAIVNLPEFANLVPDHRSDICVSRRDKVVFLNHDDYMVGAMERIRQFLLTGVVGKDELRAAAGSDPA